ncbi:hypothetical protein QW180_23675 [Vibrio sinaloensis]|nr:hypothetical protein [Vibrio sinaloensis]
MYRSLMNIAMKEPTSPDNEDLRVKQLQQLNILDTQPEERFDRVTRLAKRLFDVPIAVVSLVDSNRQWFKSCFWTHCVRNSEKHLILWSCHF